MKSLITFMVFSWILVGGSIAFSSSLTQSQVEKLTAAIWKDPPQSADITLCKEINEPAESEEKIRQMIEDSFTKTYGLKETLSGQNLERYNRDVQWNVEKILKEQQAGRKVKQRIRIDGYRQRIDQVFAQPEMVLLEGTPYESNVSGVTLDSNTPYESTFINYGDKSKGDYTNFVYYHKMKTAHKNHSKNSMWKHSDIIDFSKFPMQGAQVLLGQKENIQNGAVFVPDAGKMTKLADTGKIGSSEISINSNFDFKDRIEMKGTDGIAHAVFICDRNDYSRTYYAEIRDPIRGTPLYIRECNEFDLQGFPRIISVTEYELDGSFRKKEIYEIADVSLNPVIPDEVFAFNPPEEYQILEVYPNGAMKVVREKGGIDGAMRILLKAQKEKDVETLKNLLNHQIWQIRLRSLQVLDSLLLKENRQELKDKAETLKNDEKAEVREKAREILGHIEHLESVKKSPNDANAPAKEP